MYCPNCEMYVETTFSKVEAQEEAQRYRTWFDDENVEGDYTIADVGDVVERGENDVEWQIRLRVDTCMNCAVPIAARTYLQQP